MLHASLEHPRVKYCLRSVTSFLQCLKWAGVLVVAALSSGCDWEIDGNGKLATETRQHEGFVAVQSQTTVDVAIRHGDAFAVEVNIDSNLISLLETRVSGNRLVIDSDRSLDPRVKGPHVIITLPTLETAVLSGSGAMEIDAGEQESPVRAVLSGSGKMGFNGGTPQLSASLEGSGDIVARGTAGHVDLRIDGSGTVNARDLRASSGYLSIGGSGDIVATINGSAEAEIAGSGHIDLYGDTSVTRRSVRGSGDIRVH
jgi:hypothetical protein